jgi:hypothetical protein
MSVYPNFVKLWNFGAYGWHNPVALQNMTDVLAGKASGWTLDSVAVSP